MGATAPALDYAPEFVQSSTETAGDFQVGRFREAIALLREKADGPKMARRLGDRFVVRGFQLAEAYCGAGDWDQAMTQCQLAIDAVEKETSPDHPDGILVRTCLANIYLGMGRLDQAQKIHANAFQARKEKLGRDHPDTLQSMIYLAGAALRLGKACLSKLTDEKTAIK